MEPRRGRIDEIGDLAAMDLVAFNDSVNPWANQFITGGFKPGARHFRATIEKWGFAGLHTVADVGSGYGRWTMFLGEVSDNVFGYERNEAAVELSRKLARYFELPNLRFEAADVTKIPLEDNSVDGVWCNNGLHLFPRAKCLTEIRRILKPGGLLFLGQYSGLGTTLEKFFEGYPKGGLGDHLTKFALGSMKEAHSSETNGFTYCAPESIGRVLGAFGFELSTEPPLETQMRPGKQNIPASDKFLEEMRDIPAFAQRLEEDEALREAFAQHPEIAYRYPANCYLRAVRR